MNTDTLHVIRVEDHEGDGICGHCGREGLRWIVVMSDGSSIGSGCMKRALGIPAPAPKSYSWVSNYDLVDSRETRYDGTYHLHVRKDGRAAVIARNHVAMVQGPADSIRKEWEGPRWREW